MKPGKNIKAKTKTQKAVILTLMILLAGIVAAYAGVRNMKSGIHEFMEYKIQKELDLSDAQVNQLKTIKNDVISERENHKQTCQEELEILRTAFLEGSLEKDAINSMIEEKKKEISGHIPVIVDRIAEIHDILNQEQRVKLVDMIEILHERFESGHHSQFKNDDLFQQKMKEYMIEKTETRLGLTNDQKLWLTTFTNQLHNQKDDIKESLIQNKEMVMDVLKNQFLNNEMNTSVIVDMIRTAIPFYVINELEITEKIIEIENMLNPEQREELLVFIDEMKESHGHGKGHRRFLSHR